MMNHCWDQLQVDSLAELAAKCCIINFDSGTWTLPKDVFLPSVVCEILVDSYEKYSLHLDGESVANFLSLFAVRSATPMTRVKFIGEISKENSTMDNLLRIFLQDHYLVDVNLGYIHDIEGFPELMEQHGQNLRSLVIRASLLMLCSSLPRNLRILKVVQHEVDDEVLLSSVLSTGSDTLAHLDLSSNTSMQSLVNVDFLLTYSNLQWLSLSGVSVASLEPLYHMTNLHHLDISYSKQTMPTSDSVLYELVSRLEKLQHLNISDTNFEGEWNFEPRRKNPLNFLGVFNTRLDYIVDLPAMQVAGKANDEQLAAAASMYVGNEARQIQVFQEWRMRFSDTSPWETILYYLLGFIRRTTVLQMIGGVALVMTFVLRITERHVSKMSDTMKKKLLMTVLERFAVLDRIERLCRKFLHTVALLLSSHFIYSVDCYVPLMVFLLRRLHVECQRPKEIDSLLCDIFSTLVRGFHKCVQMTDDNGLQVLVDIRKQVPVDIPHSGHLRVHNLLRDFANL